MKNMLPNDDFPITKEDLQFIVGEEYEKIEQLAVDNSFCSNCIREKDFKMSIKSLFLLSNNDVLFRGNCTVCNGKMARLVEIGEQFKYRIKTDIVRAKSNNKN